MNKFVFVCFLLIWSVGYGSIRPSSLWSILRVLEEIVQVYSKMLWGSPAMNSLTRSSFWSQLVAKQRTVQINKLQYHHRGVDVLSDQPARTHHEKKTCWLKLQKQIRTFDLVNISAFFYQVWYGFIYIYSRISANYCDWDSLQDCRKQHWLVEAAETRQHVAEFPQRWSIRSRGQWRINSAGVVHKVAVSKYFHHPTQCRLRKTGASMNKKSNRSQNRKSFNNNTISIYKIFFYYLQQQIRDHLWPHC